MTAIPQDWPWQNQFGRALARMRALPLPAWGAHLADVRRVGKSFLVQALGYSAVRAGHTVRFSHADDFFKAIAQARVDNSLDRTFRSFITPDLLILYDLGLHRLTAQHLSEDPPDDDHRLGDGLRSHRRLVHQRAAADVFPVDGDQDAVAALYQLVTLLINLGQCNRRSSPPVRGLRIAALPRFSWRLTPV